MNLVLTNFFNNTSRIALISAALLGVMAESPLRAGDDGKRAAEKTGDNFKPRNASRQPLPQSGEATETGSSAKPVYVGKEEEDPEAPAANFDFKPEPWNEPEGCDWEAILEGVDYAQVNRDLSKDDWKEMVERLYVLAPDLTELWEFRRAEYFNKFSNLTPRKVAIISRYVDDFLNDENALKIEERYRVVKITKTEAVLSMMAHLSPFSEQQLLQIARSAGNLLYDRMYLSSQQNMLLALRKLPEDLFTAFMGNLSCFLKPHHIFSPNWEEKIRKLGGLAPEVGLVVARNAQTLLPSDSDEDLFSFMPYNFDKLSAEDITQLLHHKDSLIPEGASPDQIKDIYRHLFDMDKLQRRLVLEHFPTIFEKACAKRFDVSEYKRMAFLQEISKDPDYSLVTYVLEDQCPLLKKLLNWPHNLKDDLDTCMPIVKYTGQVEQNLLDAMVQHAKDLFPAYRRGDNFLQMISALNTISWETAQYIINHSKDLFPQEASPHERSRRIEQINGMSEDKRELFRRHAHLLPFDKVTTIQDVQEEKNFFDVISKLAPEKSEIVLEACEVVFTENMRIQQRLKGLKTLDQMFGQRTLEECVFVIEACQAFFIDTMTFQERLKYLQDLDLRPLKQSNTTLTAYEMVSTDDMSVDERLEVLHTLDSLGETNKIQAMSQCVTELFSQGKQRIAAIHILEPFLVKDITTFASLVQGFRNEQARLEILSYFVERAQEKSVQEIKTLMDTVGPIIPENSTGDDFVAFFNLVSGPEFPLEKLEPICGLVKDMESHISSRLQERAKNYFIKFAKTPAEEVKTTIDHVYALTEGNNAPYMLSSAFRSVAPLSSEKEYVAEKAMALPQENQGNRLHLFESLLRFVPRSVKQALQEGKEEEAMNKLAQKFEPVIACARFIFTDGTGYGKGTQYDNRHMRFERLFNLDQEDLKLITENAAHIFPETATGEERWNLFQSLRNLPDSVPLSEAVGLLEALSKEGQSYEERCSLISAIRTLSELKAELKLKGIGEKDYLGLIKSCAAAGAEAGPLTIKRFYKSMFLKGEEGKQTLGLKKRIKVIKILLQMSWQQLNAVEKVRKGLYLDQIKDVDTKLRILKALRKLSEEQITVTPKLLQCCFKKVKFSKEILQLIKEVAGSIPDGHTEFVETLNSLFTEEMDSKTRLNIARRLAPLSKPGIKKIVNQAKVLGFAETEFFLAVKILAELEEGQAPREFVKALNSFFTEEMDSKTRLSVAKRLAPLSKPGINKIVKFAISLGFKKAKLFKAVMAFAKLEGEQAECVVPICSRLFNEKKEHIRCSDFVKLMEVFSKASSEQLKTIIDHKDILLSKELPRKERRAIFGKLVRCHVAHLNEIVNEVQGIEDHKERAQAIETCAYAPARMRGLAGRFLPSIPADFPEDYFAALRTMVCLAKARVPTEEERQMRDAAKAAAEAKKREAAAVKIQTQFRGFQARKKLPVLKEEAAAKQAAAAEAQRQKAAEAAIKRAAAAEAKRKEKASAKQNEEKQRLAAEVPATTTTTPANTEVEAEGGLGEIRDELQRKLPNDWTAQDYLDQNPGLSNMFKRPRPEGWTDADVLASHYISWGKKGGLQYKRVDDEAAAASATTTTTTTTTPSNTQVPAEDGLGEIRDELQRKLPNDWTAHGYLEHNSHLRNMFNRPRPKGWTNADILANHYINWGQQSRLQYATAEDGLGEVSGAHKAQLPADWTAQGYLKHNSGLRNMFHRPRPDGWTDADVLANHYIKYGKRSGLKYLPE